MGLALDYIDIISWIVWFVKGFSKVFSNFFSTNTTHLRIVYPCGLPCNLGISSVIPS